MESVFTKIISRLIYKWSTFWVYQFYNLDLETNVAFKLKPGILKHKTATISIGSGTTINSSNYGYHLLMHSRCKLYADRPHSVIKIGRNTRLNGSCIHACNRISIGDNCLIAANTSIIDANGHELCMDNPSFRINTKDEGIPITIGDNVWIAANCTILGGTTIGEGAIVTAGSVVRGEIPARSIYGGNPATVFKQY